MRTLSVILLLATLLSCNPEGTVTLSDIPILRVESVSPSTVLQFQDSVVLVLAYEDVNGDLGSEDPDEQVLYVKDSRLTEADYYHIKPLAPIGSTIHIQGTLQVKINSLFLLGNGNSETVTFSVKIVDRAGNWSEETVSPPVTVVK